MTLPTIPTDLSVANQSFPSFRSDLNLILDAIKQNHAGSSRPAYAEEGMFWLDYTDTANPILKFFDGSDDITFATFNVSANTVNVSDSAFDIVTDTSPQLGGDLDLNSNDITGTGNISITGTALANTDTDTTNTGSVTLDFSANQNFVLTLTGAVTLANPTTEQVGQSGFITFIQDGTGGRAVSLGTDYETVGGAGLALSSTASATDIVPYVVVASGRILLGSPQLAFS